ncbi:metal-dependent hydrolase [beta proteobacterium AAP51]|nr:metal-dependent hydrolase [beta proteobacterium AAP51]
MKYLQGHSPELLARVQTLLDEGRLLPWVLQRHPETHTVRSDRALQAYVAELKARFLKSAPPLAKVAYDNHLHVVQQALGTHTTVSRVQGSRLQAKRELRIASVFKEAPASLLRMIVVHELAHLREREHGKAFYALCTHMEPDYHQLEFDTRLWLTAREAGNAAL